jgi:hypothetical protein
LAQLTVKTLGLGITYSLILLLLEGRDYIAYAELFVRLLREPEVDREPTRDPW